MTTITGFKADQYGAYIEKDPQANLDYSVDWSDWLAQGDNLRTSSWTISTVSGDGSPLTQTANTTNTNTSTSTIYVSGGSAGNTYTVTNHITTDNGLVDERYFRIRVKNRSL
jgi:hypothetical protein